jgi:hypothetical protein
MHLIQRAGRCLRSLSVLLFVVFLAALTYCQSNAGPQPAPPKPANPAPPPTSSSLQVEGDKTLTLDPVCNACKGAFRDLKLRNDGAEAVPLSFSHGPITSTPANKPFPAEVTIVPLSSGTPDATITSVKAHDSVTVRFTVTGVLGEAEWTVPVLNQGQSVVDIKIVNPKADFALKLDSALPENPELSFERGKTTTLLLRNDADTGYSFVATYTVNGRTGNLSSEQACENAPARPPNPCIVKIPAHGSVLMKLDPLEDWFNLPRAPNCWWKVWTWFTHPFGWSTWGLSRIGALLKDQAAPGILQVQMASTMCALDLGAPVLSFKINTHLAAFSKDGQSLGGTSIIAFVLLLGGTLSLLLNFFLPMQARRRRLRTALQQAGRKVSDLSMELDSRVRVPVGVERQRLAQRIKDLSPLNPQYGPEVTDIEQSLNRLANRLDLLEQMQRSLAGYWRSRQHDLPATLVRQLENTRQQAVDLLQKTDPSDADLQKILGFIQEIENQQNASAQANVAFAKQLIEELTHRKTERTTAPSPSPLNFNWPAAGFPDGFFAGFSGLFVVLGQELDAAPQNLDQIPPENYALLDALRIRLTLLGRFQKALLIHPAPSAAFIHASQRLLADLQNSSWDSITRSDQLVREMEEDIFPEDVIGHVREDHVRIKVDRIVVRQYEPAELSLDFANGRLRNAAARGRVHLPLDLRSRPTDRRWMGGLALLSVPDRT